MILISSLETSTSQEALKTSSYVLGRRKDRELRPWITESGMMIPQLTFDGQPRLRFEGPDYDAPVVVTAHDSLR